MITQSRLAFSALLGCLVLLPTGCGTTASPGGAEDAVKAIVAGMEEGRPVVIWEALPESYQADVNELVQAFGNNMDAAAWGQITGLVSTVHQTLASKQEFLLNYPAVLDSEDPEMTQATIKQGTSLLKTFLDSVQDLEKLKSFDGAEFMKSSGKEMAQQIVALQDMIPQTPAMKLQMAMSNVKIETIESTSTTAKLKMTSPDGKSDEVVEMVQHEGKWLPKQMVDEWESSMANAREAMAKLPEQAASMKGQMMMVSAMASGVLSPLQAAENQEQFNQAVDGMQASVGGMMGGMMGGMGGPGMGGPGMSPPSGGGSEFGSPGANGDAPAEDSNQ